MQLGPQLQLSPQAQPAEAVATAMGEVALAQLQVGSQVQGWQLHWSVIGTSQVSGFDDRYLRGPRPAHLNGTATLCAGWLARRRTCAETCG